MSKAGLPDCDGKHNRDDTSRRGQEALTHTGRRGRTGFYKEKVTVHVSVIKDQS